MGDVPRPENVDYSLQRMYQSAQAVGHGSFVGGVAAESIHDFFEMGDELGRGSFSVVHRARNRETGEEVQLKLTL